MWLLIYIQVIEIQPSVIAYIAKGLVHVGKGEKDMAYRACDIAFEHSIHLTLLSFSSPRFVCSILVTSWLPICVISTRLSSCLWPENTPMPYPGWTIWLPQSCSTQCAIWFRHVHISLLCDLNHNWCLWKAYMYLVQGNKCVERGNYQSAIWLFKCARARLLYNWHPPPMVVSLASFLTGLNWSHSWSYPTDVWMEIW